MIKCKIEAACGKDICCRECAEECKNRCDYYTTNDSCPDAIEISDLPATFETKGAAIIKSITDITLQMEKLKEQDKSMREQLLKSMEEFGIKKFENDSISFTYKAPTTRTSVDSKALKEDLPDIYDKYTKTSNVSASVAIKLKKGMGN